MALAPSLVVTDLTVCDSPSTTISSLEPGRRVWHCIEKDLYLYTSSYSIRLWVEFAREEDLSDKDLVVTDVRVGELPCHLPLRPGWENRPCGILVLRREFAGKIDQAVTQVDVLFGIDAVDPRPQWTLMRAPLQLDPPSTAPVARLTMVYGKIEPRPGTRRTLRVNANGRFKILQISDTHMVTGVGACEDAMDANGNYLPRIEADPHTVSFIEKILDREEPDLVVLTGDQLHHDNPESQSPLLKVVAPMIDRKIPYAVVFGNHDSEGIHASSRLAQMSILESLPFSLCESGPPEVTGVGNYCLPILAPSPSEDTVSTLYFLDSHGQIPSKTNDPDYAPVEQSQIDWFTKVCRAQRSEQRTKGKDIVFLHIPVPEYGDGRLLIHSGYRREPTECPSSNTHFYDTLVKEGIAALACGHDHVNDFCGLLPNMIEQDSKAPYPGPWLCYAGGSGFGGYYSYDGKRFHRRMRVWELNTNFGSLKTWSRVEYAPHRVNELVLVNGARAGEPRLRMVQRSLYVTLVLFVLVSSAVIFEAKTGLLS